jgi:sortase A
MRIKFKAGPSPFRRLLELCLLTAALMGIGVWAAGTFYPVIWQKWANRAFEREREQTTATQPAPVPEALKPREIAGRLTIPRLGMRVIVREGDDARTLAMAAGHIPGTAMPGEPGNVGIAGHRDTLLRGLGDVRQHDLIQFDSLDGKQFQYQVESTSIHSPKDVEVLNAGAYPELTLVTCYPFDYIGPAPKRFIVKARQLGTVKTAPPLILAKYEVKADVPKPRTNGGRVYFTLDVHRTRSLANGISLGLSDVDPSVQEVNGWVSIAAPKRVVWLRDQRVDQPFVFYGGSDGTRGIVVITAIHEGTVSGWFEIAGA